MSLLLVVGPWESGDWQEASALSLAPSMYSGFGAALPRPPRRRRRRPEPAPAVVPLALVDESRVAAARPDLAPREDEEDDELCLLLALELWR